ncbi:MAG: YrzE family protein, partial [Acidimicrobiales bacterium]
SKGFTQPCQQARAAVSPEEVPMRDGYAVAQEARVVTPGRSRQLVRWGSVFSGSIIAIAVFGLLDALWLALSFGSQISVVYSNLSWWIAGTAIFSMFLAGFIAGVTSGARGLGAGAMNGITTWGLIVIAVGAVVLPTFAIGHVPHTVTTAGHTYSINYLTYWTTFWSVLIGLGAALLGGALGGSLPRRADVPHLDLQRMETRPPDGGPVPVGAKPAHAASEAEPTAPSTERVVYERQAR